MDEPKELNDKWKESVSKDCILYDSTYMNCLEQANLQELKTDVWFPETRGKGRMQSDYRGW